MRNYCSFTCDGLDYFELPQPAIIKPMKLWTGKQLFNLLMRPSRSSRALSSDVDMLINTELGESQYEKKSENDLRKGRYMCPQVCC